jgi:FtsH-binding integral membrane protein
MLVYTQASIVLTFAITAGVFGTMAIYGYVTKSDLSKFGSFMTMALFGLIICIVVNMFMHSSTMEWIISFAGVVIFIGLTAWDVQKIKRMAAMSDASNEGKVATLGALSLYLDFINLFLYLLRFFGSSRD